MGTDVDMLCFICRDPSYGGEGSTRLDGRNYGKCAKDKIAYCRDCVRFCVGMQKYVVVTLDR